MNPVWLYVAATYAAAVWLARRAGVDLPWRIALFFYALVVVFMFTPPAKVFLENVSSRHLWTNLNKRLLPQDRWFGGMAWLVDGAPAKKADHVMPASASQISTGSITPAADEAPNAR